MARASRHDNQGVGWVLPPFMSNKGFSRVIDIDWINRYVNIYYFI
jgi:hypothetical protein